LRKIKREKTSPKNTISKLSNETPTIMNSSSSKLAKLGGKRSPAQMIYGQTTASAIASAIDTKKQTKRKSDSKDSKANRGLRPSIAPINISGLEKSKH